MLTRLLSFCSSVLRPCKKSKGCFRSSAAIAGQLSGDSRSKMQWSVVAWSFLLLSGAVGSDESILQSPKQITVTEGGTVRMNCVVVDKTISSIGSMSWYKDAVTRTVSNERGDYYGRVMKNCSPGTLNESIEITDIKMTETGRYYCGVGVFIGPIYHGHGTEVTVTRTVIQTPSNVNVTEGETVRINCTFVSKTIVAFSWYKDEETRAVSNKGGDYYGRVLRNSSLGTLKESMEITDLKMNDTGTYYCRVTAFTGEIYIGNGTEVTVTRPILVESPAWGLRWQLLVMGVKLATFIVINVIIVFIILSWESCGFASRRKEA